MVLSRRSFLGHSAGFGALAALVRTGILAGLSDKELAAEIGRHGVAPDFVIENLAC